MRNISSIIASHKKSILRPKAKEYGCNCRNKESCPLQNHCLTPKVIYEATVVISSDDKKRVYLGVSDTTLRIDIVTIDGILIMNVIPNVQSYRSTFDN